MRMLLIEYTGKIKETGEVFDTTDEELAKKVGIWGKNIKYGPVAVVLGKGEIIKGLEEALNEMKEGDEKSLVIPPEKGFGERKESLIKPVPVKVFEKSGIEPKAGMRVTIDGYPAKILSVSGGRVLLDFNHELAGKTLEYDIKVVKELKDDKEKVEAIVENIFPKIEKQIKIEKDVVRIAFKKPVPAEGKMRMAKAIKELTNIKRVIVEEEL